MIQTWRHFYQLFLAVGQSPSFRPLCWHEAVWSAAKCTYWTYY